MYQVAVLGDRDSVMGYRALGMTVVVVDEPSKAANMIEQLIADHYAVIFLTEEVAEQNEAYLNQLRERRLPSIIPIPSLRGSTGLGIKRIEESVRSAVGVDLLEQKDTEPA